VQPGTVLSDLLAKAARLRDTDAIVPYEDWSTPSFYYTLTQSFQERAGYPRHSPPPRDGGLLAYDPATRRLLLFGGSSWRGRYSRVLFDSWAWNGSDWTRLRSARLPTWMGGMPIAAYDPVAGRITELAPRPGYPGSFPLKATFNGNGGPLGRWLWTGRSWAYHDEDPAPPMDGGVLAPEPLSGGMLYFGYSPDVVDDPPPPDPAGTLYSQTWLWHDGHFTRQSPPRAPHPGNPVLTVSDARIGRVVVVGADGRLWAWTGTTWQPLASGHGPRAGAAAVYDPALGDLVVFGTVTRTGTPTRQTWLWNGTPLDHRPLRRGPQNAPFPAVRRPTAHTPARQSIEQDRGNQQVLPRWAETLHNQHDQ